MTSGKLTADGARKSFEALCKSVEPGVFQMRAQSNGRVSPLNLSTGSNLSVPAPGHHPARSRSMPPAGAKRIQKPLRTLPDVVANDSTDTLLGPAGIGGLGLNTGMPVKIRLRSIQAKATDPTLRETGKDAASGPGTLHDGGSTATLVPGPGSGLGLRAIGAMMRTRSISGWGLLN